MQNVVYVDSLYGSNSNPGTLLSPVATLSYAYGIVYEGGIIVLQSGTGASYGALAIAKNLTIQRAYGATPYVGALTITDAQCYLDGLTFSSIPNPITITCPSFGAVYIKECSFLGSDTAIMITSASYVSVHKNLFRDFNYGLRVQNAKEICVSGNVFTSAPANLIYRSVYVDTAQRVDFWGNTINGANSFGSSPTPDLNLRIVYQTLTSFDLTYKRVSLPSFANPADIDGYYDVAVNIANGSSYLYGVDYIVTGTGSIVSWDGYGLDGQLQVGDVLRIMYSEGGTVGAGDAVRLLNIGDANSRVDSNSISGKLSGTPGTLAIGIYFNTPVKIRNNNFYTTTTWWSGSIPTGATGLGNITADPQYIDPNTANFRLNSTSPNIDKGDPGRWSDVYTEMGIGKVGGSYTAIGTPTRTNVAPFNRSKDFLDYNRGVTGLVGVTGDMGAYEYNPGETALGSYIAENGYDIANPGTSTRPYATLDRGFARGVTGIHVQANFVPYESSTGVYTIPTYTGMRVGRYHSDEMVLSGGNLQIGQSTINDTAVIYPSYPRCEETGVVYVSPDGNDRYTGTSASPLRTITAALQKGPLYVAVLPGVYPSFKGVTGVRVIGVDQNKTISYAHPLYSNFRDGSWTGTGSYSITRDSITFSSSSNILSNFSFYGDIDLKFWAQMSVTGILTAGISNSTDQIYATFDTMVGQYAIAYGFSGTTYEVYSGLSGSTAIDAGVGINLVGGAFTVTTSGSVVASPFSNTLVSGYTGPWRVFARTVGGTGPSIGPIQLYAGGFTGGVTGTSSTEVRHKMYSLMGATGLIG